MSLKKNSFFFAIGTIFSRMSGLIRDSAISFAFGASPGLDAFFIASRIPNLFREMLAEGALTGAFTKIYTEISRESAERAKTLLQDVWSLCFFFSVAFCCFGIWLAPVLVSWMSLGSSHLSYPSELFEWTVFLTRLLFPYLGLAILGSIIMGALHQRDKFFLSAAAPIALNCGYLCGIFLMGAPTITKLALGMLLGGLLHLLVQAKGLASEERTLLWKLKIQGLWTKDSKRVFSIMLPASIAASTGPINLFINTNFAVMAGPSSISWLYYAFHVLHLPIGVVAVAVSSAALPALTKAIHNVQKIEPLERSNVDHQKLWSEVANLFFQALQMIGWLLAPFLVLFLFDAQEIMSLLFEHGRFAENDRIQVSRALQAYSFSLLAYGFQKVFSSYLYAREKTSFAMYQSIIAMGVNAGLCFLLVRDYGHVGLAWASSITILISAFLGFMYISQDKYMEFAILYKKESIYWWLALIFSALLLFLSHANLHLWIQSLNLPLKISACTKLILDTFFVFVIFYFCALRRFSLTTNQMFSSLRRKFRKEV